MKIDQAFLQKETSNDYLFRSELEEAVSLFIPDKGLQHWLLWTGISQESGLPMNRIGIYTDFT